MPKIKNMDVETVVDHLQAKNYADQGIIGMKVHMLSQVRVIDSEEAIREYESEAHELFARLRDDKLVIQAIPVSSKEHHMLDNGTLIAYRRIEWVACEKLDDEQHQRWHEAQQAMNPLASLLGQLTGAPNPFGESKA